MSTLDEIAARDEMAAAWAKVEAALPLVGWLHEDGRWVLPSGSWIIGVEYRPESGDGYFEPHYDAAYFARTQVRAPGADTWFVGDDADTPAGALQALAVRLTRELQPDGLANRGDADRIGTTGKSSEGAFAEPSSDVVGDGGEQFISAGLIHGGQVDHDLEVGTEAGERWSGHASNVQHTVENVKALTEGSDRT